jgi:hypothetical protein
MLQAMMFLMGMKKQKKLFKYLKNNHTIEGIEFIKNIYSEERSEGIFQELIDLNLKKISLSCRNFTQFLNIEEINFRDLTLGYLRRNIIEKEDYKILHDNKTLKCLNIAGFFIFLQKKVDENNFESTLDLILFNKSIEKLILNLIISKSSPKDEYLSVLINEFSKNFSITDLSVFHNENSVHDTFLDNICLRNKKIPKFIFYSFHIFDLVIIYS